MTRATRQSPDESFSFRLPAELKTAFVAAAESTDRSAAEVLRDLMRDNVESREAPEPGYDEWFRAEVQKSLDDPRPSIPHDQVVAEVRAKLEARIAKAAKRAR